jgi:hypothetical protein
VSLEPGAVIGGRYRIDAPIGGGGFGTVFRATQLNLGRPVAVKVLHAALALTESALARFRREAELAQQLTHPNIVRVFDFGQTDQGFPFIVWELLDGVTIDRAIAQQGPMSPGRVVHVASQILKALMEAHTAGIIHRDIKPANVVLCDFTGEPDFVKVLDFGVAKAVGEQGVTMTDGASPVGTPSYMAPEQVRNEPVSPATDVYALGLMMVEMMTGHVVFQGRSVVDVFMAQASADPPPIPAAVLSSPLGPVIQRATHKHPAYRYASAAAMLSELERAGAGAALGTAPTWPGTHQVSAPPPTPSPYQHAVSVPPTLGASVGAQIVTAAPQSTQSGSGTIALALFGGLAFIGILGAAVAGAIFYASRSDTPRATREASPPAVAAPQGGGAVEFGARSGKGLDGIGPSVIARKIKPHGWEIVGVPIKNIEGTFTSSQLGITKGATKGVCTLFRFDDIDEAQKYEVMLRQDKDVALMRDQAAILKVWIPDDADTAKVLVDAIRE